jgi:hypothetical protein
MRRRAAIAILLVLPLCVAVAGNYYRELLALPRQQAAAAPAANNFLWLLHFDEAAGNTNFTDSGMSNITLITRGAAISNTVGGKFGNCVSFPQGTGYRRIELVDLEKRLANVGTNDWTVDFWVYLTAGSANGAQMLFGLQPGSAQRPFVYIYKGASNSMRVASAAVSSAYASDATANPSWNNYADAWTHIAVCRYTNVVMLYMNGVRQNQYNATLSGNPSYSWATCTNQTIGAPADENMPGMNYYDEIALRRRAVWQGTNFTPPTAAYTGSE